MGIEISITFVASPCLVSYPARGMGIEIYRSEIRILSPAGHTPRGVWGLKFVATEDFIFAKKSYPARGMGIEMALIRILRL